MENRENNIALTLPYPPLTNNLYITLMISGKDGVKKPVRVPSGEAKKFKAAVEKMLKAQRLQPFIGDVAVSLNVYRPRKVGDLDGSFKAVLDSLKGFAYYDDKQIVEIHAKRHDDKFNPRVEIEISPIGLY